MPQTLADQLLEKSKSVISDYKSFIVFDEKKVVIDEDKHEIYSSMKRWHFNAHKTQTYWKEMFTKSVTSLDVKEKMNQLDTDLKNFLKKKFKASGPKDQFSICGILEFLVSDVRQLYQIKLDERDSEVDEFNTDQIYQGILPEDLLYFNKVFLPAALFFTYLSGHPNSDRNALMNDIFTIGSGSQTDLLEPELTAVCKVCAAEKGFEHFNEKEIELLNMKILEVQIKKKFHSSFKMIYSDSSDMGSSVGSDFWFNPFSSSSSLDENLEVSKESGLHENEIVHNLKFSCNLCEKKFSSDDFLGFHKECFHKTSPVVKSVTFVGEPQDLITSFCHEPSSSSSDVVSKQGPTILASKTGKSEATGKVETTTQSKKGVRKSLRFSDNI